jgi:hypothetical protein
MALKRVYLDQRDWIRLARQHYGRANDEATADVLALVREASAAGLASFPLSAAHYFETYRQHDPERRRRLGAFMAEISRLNTIAGAPDLLEAEVEVAFRALAGAAPARQPRVFGRGAAHAFGQPDMRYFTDPDLERRAIAHLGTDRVFEFFETALLVGPLGPCRMARSLHRAKSSPSGNWA